MRGTNLSATSPLRIKSKSRERDIAFENPNPIQGMPFVEFVPGTRPYVQYDNATTSYVENLAGTRKFVEYDPRTY